MNCTNPNCECKPGTFANLNPPRVQGDTDCSKAGSGDLAPTPHYFVEWMLYGLEWQPKVALKTDSGKYRVEITWALDRYRVSVYRTLHCPPVRVHHPKFTHTAVATANKLLRYYASSGTSRRKH